MRNEPPISISSPREISTSRPAASAFERQHQRAGGVVHHQRVLRAGEPREAARGSGRCGCPGCRCRDRARGCCSRRRPPPSRATAAGGQRRAAEVGVQHDAGGVEHRRRLGRGALGEPLADLRGPVLGRPGPPGARRVERLPHGGDHAAPRRAWRSSFRIAGSRSSRSTEGSSRRRSVTGRLRRRGLGRLGGSARRRLDREAWRGVGSRSRFGAAASASRAARRRVARRGARARPACRPRRRPRRSRSGRPGSRV